MTMTMMGKEDKDKDNRQLPMKLELELESRVLVSSHRVSLQFYLTVCLTPCVCVCASLLHFTNFDLI